MDEKNRLFEMMEKINPDFNINELYDSVVQKSPTTPQANNNQQNTSASQPRQSMDSMAVDKFTQKSTQLKNYSSRIDTPKEFQESFLNWFKTTGFVTSGKKISVAQALSMVKTAMTSLGFK